MWGFIGTSYMGVNCYILARDATSFGTYSVCVIFLVGKTARIDCWPPECWLRTRILQQKKEKYKRKPDPQELDKEI